jgi:hypothetical protein
LSAKTAAVPSGQFLEYGSDEMNTLLPVRPVAAPAKPAGITIDKTKPALSMIPPHRWRNLIILKNGTTRWAEKIWATEEEARIAANTAVARYRILLAEGLRCEFGAEPKPVRWYQFKSVVQMPYFD